MDTYEKQYLKYKNKYLSLKKTINKSNQIGGAVCPLCGYVHPTNNPCVRDFTPDEKKK